MKKDLLFLETIINLLMNESLNPMGVDIDRVFVLRDYYSMWKEDTNYDYKNIDKDPAFKARIEALQDALDATKLNVDPELIFVKERDAFEC